MGVPLEVTGFSVGTTLEKTGLVASVFQLLMCQKVVATVEMVVCMIILKILLLLVTIIWHKNWMIPIPGTSVVKGSGQEMAVMVQVDNKNLITTDFFVDSW